MKFISFLKVAAVSILLSLQLISTALAQDYYTENYYPTEYSHDDYSSDEYTYEDSYSSYEENHSERDGSTSEAESSSSYTAMEETTSEGDTEDSGDGTDSESSEDTETTFSIKDWFMTMVTFSSTRSVCQADDCLDEIPATETFITGVETQIAAAETTLATLEATNCGDDYDACMELESDIQELKGKIEYAKEFIDSLKTEIQMCKDGVKEAEEQFVSMCSDQFESSCRDGLSQLPAFLQPTITDEQMAERGKNFCEGQLSSILGWQCDYEDAKEANDQACQAQYDADMDACSGFLCAVNALIDLRNCKKNIPGYAQPIDYNEKFKEMQASGIAACGGAALTNMAGS